MKLNEPQNIEQNFDELELVAEKAGELNDRVGKIENELGAQTKTLESAAMVLDAAIKGLGALKHQVLENDIGALQLALNDKTAHLAREIGRFESAIAEIDRRAEAGDEQLAASLRDIALGLRSSFDAKSAEIAEWSVRVEREIAAHSVALAAIPPIIKGADAKPFNPRGEWQAGMVANSLDVVSYNGSSYISNEDGNTEKPTRSTKYTTLAKRSGNGAGGATDFGSLTGTILPAQVVPGSATYAVGDVLYAGTTGALSKLGAGSSGQLLSTQGAGAAPRWVSATGGAGDVNGPASATDNAIVRFDGTGGKTVQNSAVTIADTTGDIAGASSLTAPASTDLTLAGGTAGTSSVVVSNTLAASSAIIGAFKVGNGTAATNVAIGAGNINAGGTLTVGGAASVSGTSVTVINASNPTYNLWSNATPSKAGQMYLDTSGNATKVGYYNGSAWNYGLTVLAASTSLDGGPVTIASTTPSTGVGFGALQVAGGIYAGAASVFGGSATVSPGASVLSSRGNFYALQLTGTDAVAAAGLMFSSTNTNPVGLLSFAPNTGTLTWAARSAAGNLSGNDLFSIATTGAATFAGAVSLSTAGTTVSIKSGTNAAAGTVTLVGGTATITSTAIDVNTVIVMSVKTSGGTIGDHTPSVKVNAGNAVITGSSSDTSTYNWVALKVN